MRLIKNTITITLLSLSTLSATVYANDEEWQIIDSDDTTQEASPSQQEKTQQVERTKSVESTKPVEKQSSKTQTQPKKKQRQARRSSGGSGVFELGLGIDQGLSIVGQIHNTVNVALGNDGIAADYLLAQGRLSGAPLNWFAGVGGQITDNDGWGPRAVIGIEHHFERRWNLYGHLTPSIMFDADNDHHNHHHDDDDDTEFGINIAFGVRYAL
ncbi:hypothetical protein N9R79_11785 [Vibrio sp.]|nr:hypothetical protein [Vibrio sp.]